MNKVKSKTHPKSVKPRQVDALITAFAGTPYAMANEIQRAALDVFQDAKKGKITPDDARNLTVPLRVADRTISHQINMEKNTINAARLQLTRDELDFRRSRMLTPATINGMSKPPKRIKNKSSKQLGSAGA